MLCIFCMYEKPERKSGGEHIFPVGIGGAFTVKRVCQDCDSRLGNFADSPLQQQFDVEQRRIEFKLRGHRRTVPDPIAEAIKRPLPHPTEPGQRVRIRRSDDGSTNIESVTHIEYETGRIVNGRRWIKASSNTVINPRDSDSVPMLSRSALRKIGIRDEATIEAVTRDLIESLETHNQSLTVAVPVPIRKGGHQLGLLKIAYELAWLWLGDLWLEDLTAQAMRRILAGDFTASGDVTLNASMDLGEILERGGLNPRTTHIAFLSPAFGRLMLIIRLFDAHTIGVIVTDDPQKYQLSAENVLVNDTTARRAYQCTMEQLIGKPLLVVDGNGDGASIV
ncbi:MAG: HNH endonuclease [Vulcanimicrobiaceae bacterium]|jgi:hypothetical protein